MKTFLPGNFFHFTYRRQNYANEDGVGWRGWGMKQKVKQLPIPCINMESNHFNQMMKVAFKGISM